METAFSSVWNNRGGRGMGRGKTNENVHCSYKTMMIHSMLNRPVANLRKNPPLDLSKSCPTRNLAERFNRAEVEDITRRRPTAPKNMFELLRKGKKIAKENREVAKEIDKHDDSDDGEGSDNDNNNNGEKGQNLTKPTEPKNPTETGMKLHSHDTLELPRISKHPKVPEIGEGELQECYETIELVEITEEGEERPIYEDDDYFSSEDDDDESFESMILHALSQMLCGIDKAVFTRDKVEEIRDHLCSFNKNHAERKIQLEERRDRYAHQIEQFRGDKKTLDLSVEELKVKRSELANQLEALDGNILITCGKSRHISNKITKRRESIRNAILPKISKLNMSKDTAPLKRLFTLIEQQNAMGSMDTESLRRSGLSVSWSADNVLEIEVPSSVPTPCSSMTIEEPNKDGNEVGGDDALMASSVEDSEFDEKEYLLAAKRSVYRGPHPSENTMVAYAQEISKRYPPSANPGKREYVIPPTYPSYYYDHHNRLSPTTTNNSKGCGDPEEAKPKNEDPFASSSSDDESSTLETSSSSSNESNYWSEDSSSSSSSDDSSAKEELSEETRNRRQKRFLRKRARLEELERRLVDRRSSSGRFEFVQGVADLLQDDNTEKLPQTLAEGKGGKRSRKRKKGGEEAITKKGRSKGKKVAEREEEKEEDLPPLRFDSTIMNGSLCVTCGSWNKSAYFDRNVHVCCGPSCVCCDCGKEREECTCQWFFTQEMLISFEDYTYDFGTKSDKTFPQAMNVRKREFNKHAWLRTCNLRDIWKMLQEATDQLKVIDERNALGLERECGEEEEKTHLMEKAHTYSLIWKNWLRRFVMQKDRYGEDNFRVLVTVVYMIMELRLVCKENPELSPKCCTYCQLPFGPKKGKRGKVSLPSSSPKSPPLPVDSSENSANGDFLESQDSQGSAESVPKRRRSIRPSTRSSKTNNLCASCKNFTGDRFVKKYSWVVEAMTLFYNDFGDCLTTKKREKLAKIVDEARVIAETKAESKTEKEGSSKKRKKRKRRKKFRKERREKKRKKKQEPEPETIEVS